MIDFNDYFYFVQVVEKGGFAAAGRALSIPKSRLSRRVSQLEARLGARLIHRTSRRLVVTDTGQDFYINARAMLDQADAAEAAVKRRTDVLSGSLRLSCSIGIAQFAIRNLVARFVVNHPKINVMQQVTNESVDLIAAGVDLAIRGHTEQLPDSSLIQRRLATTTWRLFAGTPYIEREGLPSSPEELEGRPALKLGWKSERSEWLLRKSEETVSVPFSPRLCSDDMVTLKQAACAGAGIVALPDYTCRTEIEAGDLSIVLPEWHAGEAEITLLMPSRQGIMPAVQAFIDFLGEQLPSAVRG